MPNLKPQSVINALTIDLEDWVQSVYDPNRELTDCFRRNTERILEILDARGTKATFFVLGLAAEKAPDLIRRLHAEGHEIQSHGYGHRAVHSQTPAQFRHDLRQSKAILEDIVATEVSAYRAPAFSIGRQTPWAMDVLAECGFRVDSSLFPVRMRRYGSGRTPRTPFRNRTASGHEILEFPVASYQLGPVRLPAGGGGYLRLLPLGLFRLAIRQLNAQGAPAVLYVHPYELAPEEFADLPMSIPASLRLAQGLGRGNLADRLATLLDEFPFGRLADTATDLLSHPFLNWPVSTASNAASVPAPSF